MDIGLTRLQNLITFDCVWHITPDLIIRFTIDDASQLEGYGYFGFRRRHYYGGFSGYGHGYGIYRGYHRLYGNGG
jgi:hypothetical protein